METLEKYNDIIDSTELAKIAIDHSDGIVKVSQNIPDALVEYADKSAAKVIAHSGDDFAKDYIEFYESL